MDLFLFTCSDLSGLWCCGTLMKKPTLGWPGKKWRRREKGGRKEKERAEGDGGRWGGRGIRRGTWERKGEGQGGMGEGRGTKRNKRRGRERGSGEGQEGRDKIEKKSRRDRKRDSFLLRLHKVLPPPSGTTLGPSNTWALSDI